MPRSFPPIIAALVALLVPVLSGHADRAADIDALVQKHFADGKIHGSVLVAEHGEIVYKGGVGMANYEWDIPNASDTKHRLGSITKQFTATLILQLREENKLTLEDTILTHLPDYRADTGAKITIHNLLTHTSGLPNYTNPEFFKNDSRNFYAVTEFIAKFCSGDLEFEPGERWAYCNSGYFILGAIVEKVTGKTYEEVLRERILDPVGMADTGYDHHETLLKRRATGYDRKDGAILNSPYLDMALPYSAGSLYSTVEDLYKWDRALYTDTLLTEDSKKLMFTRHKNNYGYGWMIKPLRPEGVEDKTLVEISHGGGINGFNTLITRDPQQQHLVVILNNATPSDSAGLTKAIIDLLYSEK